MEAPVSQKSRWFQFTLRRGMIALFWLAVCFASALRVSEGDVDDLDGFLALLAMCLAPFVAGGTLFGHPFIGLLIGIAATAIAAGALFLAVENEWIVIIGHVTSIGAVGLCLRFP